MFLASVLKGHSDQALRVLLRHGNDAPAVCQSSALGTRLLEQRSCTLDLPARQGCDTVDKPHCTTVVRSLPRVLLDLQKNKLSLHFSPISSLTHVSVYLPLGPTR